MCITYNLSDASLVNLDVFGVNGEKVKRLVNENKTPGSYMAKLCVSKESGSLYIIRLVTGRGVETLKVLL